VCAVVIAITRALCENVIAITRAVCVDITADSQELLDACGNNRLSIVALYLPYRLGVAICYIVMQCVS